MSDHERPDVPPALRKLAAWSWRLLVVLTAAGLVLYLLILLKVIVVPVIVALFLATLLVPLVSCRRPVAGSTCRRCWPCSGPRWCCWPRSSSGSSR